jgi:hypothetical protein
MTAVRRLAAILAADVVGYSRLMGEDEAGTARAVSKQLPIAPASFELSSVHAGSLRPFRYLGMMGEDGGEAA